ncbi:MAG TPA: ABC transporter substrate-binding protein [Pyrinomonadaceae bacterium]|nr:ABC transporter substrate-binding protein [Pyrinomonadaceae bacterium]
MTTRKFILVVVLALLMFGPAGCRRRTGNAFVIALGDNIRTIDPIGSPSVDAASERVRTLIFNSLVKKDERFDYTGELASNILRSDDGLTFSFTLRDGVKFHDGRVLSSADVKYTLDLVLSKDFAKSASFFEGTGNEKRGYIKSVEAPDERTIIVTLTKPWVGLLSNLVPISIIPKDSYESQKTHPLGTGPFKFVSYDNTQQVCDIEAFPEYWEGAPKLQKVRVRVIADMNAMQSELQAGRVDIAPMPTSLSPDAVKRLEQDANLQVKVFNGSNVILLTINTSSPPLDNVKVRQAIAHAIDRESLIRDLLLGYGKIAHSIIPEESWSYTPGTTYSYDPARAKQLLDEAGFTDPDGDGPRMRFAKPVVYKVSGSSIAGRQYAGVIQNYLKNVGIPLEIQTPEANTLFDELRRGNFQIAYSQWVGGNQDPIFYKDLFATSEIPTEKRPSRNRSRYSNPELDKLLEEAVNTFDRQRGKELYTRIQEIVSRDVPVFPWWYQSNIVIARKNVGNIQVNASGDWGFIRNLTVTE